MMKNKKRMGITKMIMRKAKNIYLLKKEIINKILKCLFYENKIIKS